MKTATTSKLEKRIRAEIEIGLWCEPENVPYVGNCMASGDPKVNKRAENWIRRQLDGGNEWAWCQVTVAGRWNGLEERDYLGCCSYRSAADFRKPGDYFDDMKETVIRAIVERAEAIRAD